MAETIGCECNDMTGERNMLPVWKRILDLGMIVLALPGILLIAGAVTLVIKLGSAGPVLFRQRRVGFKGRQFTCFKFRTMHLGAETESHRCHTAQLIRSQTPMVKLDSGSDPRVIPLGKALRSSGLDELPQLINVVRGEMSVVGPRPCIPYEYELYEPWQKERFRAVPGLTGLWQVSGKNHTTFDEMIRLDVQYSERLSLKLDLLIIVKTLPALWRQCRESRARKSQRSGLAAELGKGVQTYRL